MTRPTPTTLRLPDWEERLAEALRLARHRAFAWGTHDCWLAAADVALAITGRDPATPERGAYDTEDGADAVLEAAGGLEALVAGRLAEFGAADCPAPFAQRGDLVLVQAGNIVCCGVVADHRVAVPGPDGMSLLRPERVIRAWAV